MKKTSVFRISILVILAVFTHNLYSRIDGFKKIRWERGERATLQLFNSSTFY